MKSGGSTAPSVSMGRTPSGPAPAPIRKDNSPQKPQMEVNLFDFDDEPVAAAPVANAPQKSRLSFDGRALVPRLYEKLKMNEFFIIVI